jgi:hypothetical protein
MTSAVLTRKVLMSPETVTDDGASRNGFWCAICGEAFTPPRRDARYCSPACRQSAYRERVRIAETAAQAPAVYTAAAGRVLGEAGPGRVVLIGPQTRRTWTRAERILVGYRTGRVTAAIICLSNFGVCSLRFRPFWEDGLVCFVQGRIDFTGNGRPVFGSIFVYLGPEPDAFQAEFERFGAVMARTDHPARREVIPPATEHVQ